MHKTHVLAVTCGNDMLATGDATAGDGRLLGGGGGRIRIELV